MLVHDRGEALGRGVDDAQEVRCLVDHDERTSARLIDFIEVVPDTSGLPNQERDLRVPARVIARLDGRVQRAISSDGQVQVVVRHPEGRTERVVGGLRGRQLICAPRGRCGAVDVDLEPESLRGLVRPQHADGSVGKGGDDADVVIVDVGGQGDRTAEARVRRIAVIDVQVADGFGGEPHPTGGIDVDGRGLAARQGDRSARGPTGPRLVRVGRRVVLDRIQLR